MIQSTLVSIFLFLSLEFNSTSKLSNNLETVPKSEANEKALITACGGTISSQVLSYGPGFNARLKLKFIKDNSCTVWDFWEFPGLLSSEYTIVQSNGSVITIDVDTDEVADRYGVTGSIDFLVCVDYACCENQQDGQYCRLVHCLVP